MRTLEQLHKEISRTEKRDFLRAAIVDLYRYDTARYQADKLPNCPPLENAKALAGAELIEYLPFAFSKALGHRGLSAMRSVLHLQNWLWLMEDEELYNFACDEKNHTNYGVPVLKRVARRYGVTLPPEIASWPDGGPCIPDCCCGCNE